ncbi:hypothetical protein AGR7A_pAt20135 [Agrobacterium deltaense NCPPB 1641]|uniref:Uncharacterized protein n=1 Tax=Agrobacterium deltaense NCPPB 1641 TaxID=1183425 RepID=A0A1S7UA01_9HYPH|nr:hypothetical protein AGR7A_pAt20135 [Agrobacterium deltaense NCPPB 1641]
MPIKIMNYNKRLAESGDITPGSYYPH